MSARQQVGGLQVAKILHDLVADELLPGSGIEADHFWSSLEKIVVDLAPRNRELLARRDELQAQIDLWHRDNPSLDEATYRAFLEEIGYLLPEPEDFFDHD